MQTYLRTFTPEQLLNGESGLGKMVLLGGHHSGAAFKRLCAEYKDKDRLAVTPWAAARYTAGEVLPIRDCMLYRLSRMPENRLEGQGDDVKDKVQLKMQFARLMASTDNMTARETAAYKPNTWFL